MSIINIISIACFALIVIGFFIGFIRSFKKSLTRFILIALCLVAAIFVSPLLSSFLIKTFVSGYVFNGFGFSFDFKEFVETNIGAGGDAVGDIMNAQATETLVASIMNLAVNIVAFFAIFIILVVLTLIFFWIGSLIARFADRKNPNYEIKKANRKKLSYRLAGGLFGVFSSLAFCFVLAVPVFGIMNICDKFLEQSQTESASAYSAVTYADGELYYKDNEQIGQVETLIEQYAQIRQTINDSAVGKVANVIGLSQLGMKTFDYLTTVNQGGLDVSMTNEIVAVIRVYNAYKVGFVENHFDAESKESIAKAIDSIEQIYNEANKSTIVKSYLIEFIPKFREKWVAGETFMGIEFPVKGEYADLALMIIDKGFNTYNITEINNNVYSVIGVARIANESGLIKAIQDEVDIFDFVKEDNTNIIKNVVVKLSESKFKDALPTLIEDIIKKAYDIVIDTNDILTEEEIDSIFADVDGNLPDDIDWEDEGLCLQNLIKNSLNIVDIFYSDENATDLIIENLDKLGMVIDSARMSAFSNHFKILVNKMINTKIDRDILGEETMEILTVKLDVNWSNANFRFSDMFNVLKQTALIAQKITVDTEGSTNLNDIVDNLESVVADIIENPQVKETFITILERDVINQFIPEEHSETANVLKDMVGSFMNNTTVETLKMDIAAGKEIINIVNDSVNNGAFSLEDETLTKEQKAEEIIETITSSNAIMTVIETATSDTSATNKLAEMAQNLGGDDVELLKNAIEDLDTTSSDAIEQSKNEENKTLLMKLFGLA